MVITAKICLINWEKNTYIEFALDICDKNGDRNRLKWIHEEENWWKCVSVGFRRHSVNIVFYQMNITFY